MANRLRQLLILISLIGLLTSGMWVFYPGAVEWVDWAARGVWMERIEVDLDKARRMRAEGQLDEAAEVLAELIEWMDGVQIGDRRDPWMRTAMRERIAILRKADRLDDAIACARQYHEYAPRDVENTLNLGVLMLRSEAHADQGLKVLADLQRLLPEWSRVADAYAKALVARGRDRAALEVGLDFLKRGESLQSRDWMVFWDLGNSFEGAHSLRLDLEQVGQPGDFKAKLRIPRTEAPMRAIRLDPPVWPCLRVSNWTVTVKLGDQVIAFDKPEQLMKQSRMRPAANRSLETTWEAHSDMRFEFAQPVMLDKNSTIEIELHLVGIFPPGTRQLFDDPKRAMELIKWLRESGRRDDIDRVRKALGN